MKRLNLFALVEKDSNRAVCLFESAFQYHIDTSMHEIKPVINTGVTTHRTKHGTITSMSIYILDDNDSVYYLITSWPDSIGRALAYELINK